MTKLTSQTSKTSTSHNVVILDPDDSDAVPFLCVLFVCFISQTSIQLYIDIAATLTSEHLNQ